MEPAALYAAKKSSARAERERENEVLVARRNAALEDARNDGRQKWAAAYAALAEVETRLNAAHAEFGTRIDEMEFGAGRAMNYSAVFRAKPGIAPLTEAQRITASDLMINATFGADPNRPAVQERLYRDLPKWFAVILAGHLAAVYSALGKQREAAAALGRAQIAHLGALEQIMSDQRAAEDRAWDEYREAYAEIRGKYDAARHRARLEKSAALAND